MGGFSHWGLCPEIGIRWPCEGQTFQDLWFLRSHVWEIGIICIYPYIYIPYPLVMTNSLPWWRHGPNRNRWFTELKHVDLSMAMFNNQMIYIYIYIYYFNSWYESKLGYAKIWMARTETFFFQNRSQSPGSGILTPTQIIWVNYNDLTATSLESWLIRGIIPKWP